MRSKHLGLLHLGKFKTKERKDMRRMRLGLLHLGQQKIKKVNK
jgi:hypothetical protein